MEEGPRCERDSRSDERRRTEDAVVSDGDRLTQERELWICVVMGPGTDMRERTDLGVVSDGDVSERVEDGAFVDRDMIPDGDVPWDDDLDGGVDLDLLSDLGTKDPEQRRTESVTRGWAELPEDEFTDSPHRADKALFERPRRLAWWFCYGLLLFVHALG